MMQSLRMTTNWTDEEIKNEIEMLKKQTPATTLPPHLWAVAAKNSLKQKSFGFSIVDVTPKGFGPNE